MRINANARKVLINGGGIVEQSFTPGRYCMALSASAYGSWRFDEQGVPHDLQKR
jgi:lipoxygenase